MLAKFIPLIALLSIVRCELPVGRRAAPYAAAGWQPRVPFNLPNEYLPPSRARGSGVEISKERVELAGKVKPPQTNYLTTTQLVGTEAEALPESILGTAVSPSAPEPDPAFKIIYPDDEESASADQQQSNIREGRYYIVAKDNKIQRVSFRALQQLDGDEDFTAQLRYSTVGQLQDPAGAGAQVDDFRVEQNTFC
ncbi:uncharacterized protein LOC117889880 [Drosophila subobscura]|uniref:uncharacterized protein LOC117889880 n=1 Tax=Drosophila subobscura TaxID=7241 RepID=UPI00155A93D6|nr:uncharacterized protein LOC117889880 [Drosophila subobscura]